MDKRSIVTLSVFLALTQTREVTLGSDRIGEVASLFSFILTDIERKAILYRQLLLSIRSFYEHRIHAFTLNLTVSIHSPFEKSESSFKLRAS